MIKYTTFLMLVLLLVAISGQAELIAHWAFDESSGSTAGDSSINVNTGNLYGNAYFSTGKFGNAIYLDGNGDYVLGSNLPISSPFSISVWYNRASSSEPNGVILRNGQFSLQFSSSSVYGYVNTVGSGWIFSEIAGLPSVGTWEHYAIIWNGSEVVAYRNGLAGTSIATTGAIGYGDSDNRLYAGSWYGHGTWQTWGAIDEARVYNQVLTQQELISLKDFNHITIPEPSLLAYYAIACIIFFRKRNFLRLTA